MRTEYVKNTTKSFKTRWYYSLPVCSYLCLVRELCFWNDLSHMSHLYDIVVAGDLPAIKSLAERDGSTEEGPEGPKTLGWGALAIDLSERRYLAATSESSRGLYPPKKRKHVWNKRVNQVEITISWETISWGHSVHTWETVRWSLAVRTFFWSSTATRNWSVRRNQWTRWKTSGVAKTGKRVRIVTSNGKCSWQFRSVSGSWKCFRISSVVSKLVSKNSIVLYSLESGNRV